MSPEIRAYMEGHPLVEGFSRYLAQNPELFQDLVHDMIGHGGMVLVNTITALAAIDEGIKR